MFYTTHSNVVSVRLTSAAFGVFMMTRFVFYCQRHVLLFQEEEVLM